MKLPFTYSRHTRGAHWKVDSDDDPKIYNDTVIFAGLERSKAGGVYYPTITKTGQNLSCRGGNNEAADAATIVRQAVGVTNLIYYGR